ncbi:hypothetical protein QN277_007727 [Acacia crassicarpa]|uniref:DUF4283 domain-containing protein n=1 Tax=Acacia crassicarpa TaxID=499986 RepID=A0AAE1IWH7_9FABA|nr:hypothetical protein QN277_007727 [Acacia crassicarpa]
MTSSTSLLSLSREEDDQLMRSSKKVKNGGNGDNSKMAWPSLSNKGSGYQKGGMSFADKLKGSDDEAVQETAGDRSDDEMDEGDQDKDAEPLFVIKEDSDRNFPTFTFSEKIKKRLYKPWRKSVIVKLMDKTIGYKALLTRLQYMWAKKGALSLIDIGHGFFVVKLYNKDDYLNALTGGPWMIYDHYLTVRPWEPNFHPARAKIDKVAVWVRVPKMFLEYYDREALTIIGDRIGETIKVDINTSNQLRGRYARICVLVNLKEQLMAGFRLDGEEYTLEYEGLHLLCSECGIYGHVGELCPSRRKVQNNGDGSNHNDRTMAEPVTNQIPGNTSLNRDLWKVVQKPRRSRKPKDGKEGPSKNDGQGSRFEVLAQMADQQQGDTAMDDEQEGRGMTLVVSKAPSQSTSSVRLQEKGKKSVQSAEKNNGKESDGSQEQVKGSDLEKKKRVEKRARGKRDGVLTMILQKDGCGQNDVSELRNEGVAGSSTEALGEDGLDGILLSGEATGAIQEGNSGGFQPVLDNGANPDYMMGCDTGAQNEVVILDPGEDRMKIEDPDSHVLSVECPGPDGNVANGRLGDIVLVPETQLLQ